MPTPAPKKIGPNDPCPCGSGKRYKKCHWGTDTAFEDKPASASTQNDTATVSRPQDVSRPIQYEYTVQYINLLIEEGEHING